MSKCPIRPMLICILSAYANSVLAAGDFGYLFTSAKQRQVLNELRVHQTPQPEKVSAAPILQGYVKRSDGVSTLWFDQAPVRQMGEQVIVNAQPR